MKIIYDTEQPKEKRLEVVGNDGTSYFGFHCFQIQLDDGKELVEVERWGNAKKRRDILDAFKGGAK